MRRLIYILPLILTFLSSCNAIYDDLEECPRGVVMRFIFDHNLEFANAFPNQVDCLGVYIFDKEGSLVTHVTETSDVLADEDWRLTLDLPAGEYKAVAYGGMQCDKASFAHSRRPGEISRFEDLDAILKPEYMAGADSRPRTPLHDLFYGSVDFTVNEGTDYDRVTLPMMRDTNHVRIVLQHIDNSPVDDKDFTFEIIDDNTMLDCRNDVVSSGVFTYLPWSQGTKTAGSMPDSPTKAGDAADVQVAFAELSTSRLIYDSKTVWTHDDGRLYVGPRLRIRSLESGHNAVDIPLNNYLLLTKSEAFAKMPPQEFLDRASRYSLVFFLDRDNRWVRMNIEVGPWTVRVDNIDFK